MEKKKKPWLNRPSSDRSPSSYANSEINMWSSIRNIAFRRPLLVIFNLINILTVTLLMQ